MVGCLLEYSVTVDRESDSEVAIVAIGQLYPERQFYATKVADKEPRAISTLINVGGVSDR